MQVRLSILCCLLRFLFKLSGFKSIRFFRCILLNPLIDVSDRLILTVLNWSNGRVGKWNVYFALIDFNRIKRSFSVSLSDGFRISFGSIISIFLFNGISETIGRIISLLAPVSVVVVDVRLVLIRGNVRFKSAKRDGKSLIE